MDTKQEDSKNKPEVNSLWPWILEDNICDTRAKNTSEYFVQERDFDYLWAHSLLASKCFENYKKPIDMHCCDEACDDNFDYDMCEHDSDSETEEKPNVTLAKQDSADTVDANDQQSMEKIAVDFLYRKTPWYSVNPTAEKETPTVENLDGEFKRTLDVDLIRDIQTYDTRLMIIAVPFKANMEEVKTWLKYCRYAHLIMVVSSETLTRQLQLLNKTVETVTVANNQQKTWQEEVDGALTAGVERAKELHLIRKCVQPFVFVFSKERGKRTCDSFKIIRTF